MFEPALLAAHQHGAGTGRAARRRAPGDRLGGVSARTRQTPSWRPITARPLPSGRSLSASRFSDPSISTGRRVSAEKTAPAPGGTVAVATGTGLGSALIVTFWRSRRVTPAAPGRPSGPGSGPTGRR